MVNLPLKKVAESNLYKQAAAMIAMCYQLPVSAGQLPSFLCSSKAERCNPWITILAAKIILVVSWFPD